MIQIRCLKLLPYLLAGSACNIGVAWICAVCVNTSSGVQETASSNSSSWDVVRYSRPGAALFWSQRIGRPSSDGGDGPESPPARLLPSWSHYAVPSHELVSGTRSYDIQYGDARGWPMLAFWSTPRHSLETSLDGVPTRIDRPVTGGIATGLEPWKISFYDSPKTLPYRPIWVGLAVNTAFYTSIVWLAVALASVLRRSLRRFRGECPSCAYQLHGAPQCSECGNA